MPDPTRIARQLLGHGSIVWGVNFRTFHSPKYSKRSRLKFFQSSSNLENIWALFSYQLIHSLSHAWVIHTSEEPSLRYITVFSSSPLLTAFLRLVFSASHFHAEIIGARLPSELKYWSLKTLTEHFFHTATYLTKENLKTIRAEPSGAIVNSKFNIGPSKRLCFRYLDPAADAETMAITMPAQRKIMLKTTENDFH